MALIKKRPKIQLLLPRVIHPGERVGGSVVLDARSLVRVERVAVELVGIERSVVGSGKQASRSSRELVRSAAELSRARTLPVGKTRLDFELPLPANLPPSFHGRRAHVEYTLRVHAPIRWWPDARGDFEVQVAPPPAKVLERPRLYASDPAGPRGREPHLECSLASDAITPGGMLVGSVALHNVAYNRYRELALTFVATERAFNRSRRRSSDEHPERYGARIPLESPAEGQALPFSLRLPERARPSAESRLWSYSWALEVRVVIPWARDLVLAPPLVVLPAGSTTRRATAAPPTVGSERVRAVWEAVAGERGLRLDGERLVGAIDGVELSIAREHRGGAGIFLVGELRWPSLGLELDGGARTGFRRLFHGGEVDLGDPAWRKASYLTGREAAQVRAFGAALGPRLFALAGIDDIDDCGLRALRRDSGQTRTALAELAAGLAGLASALGAARAAIPPPALMREAAPRWAALAAQLGGRLENSRMAVLGASVDGLATEVVTEWHADGAPRRTLLSVAPAQPLAAEQQLEWLSGAGWPQTGALPADAATLVQELADQVRSLALRADRLELALDAPLLDPAPVAPLLRKLAALCRLLEPRGGPYR